MGQMVSMLTCQDTGVQCEAELPCGHGCTLIQAHKTDCICRKNCPFLYPCGHRCKKRCSGTSKPELAHAHPLEEPCRQPCRLRCIHGKPCGAKCSEPCRPCRARCRMGCKEHGECGKGCGEWRGCQFPRGCERPCQEECGDCGTKCVGLCGHRCPPCIKCSPFTCPISWEEFQVPVKSAGKRRKTGKKAIKASEKQLIAYTLKDCGCTFELSSIDTYMHRAVKDMLFKSKKTIACPSCAKPVLTSPRYSWEARRLLYHKPGGVEPADYQPISADEIKMVVETMKGPHGYYAERPHWYKCSRGHPFFVGECGHPTQPSVCLECKARVGLIDNMVAGTPWNA